MDIGGTNLRIGLVDKQLNVHSLKIFPTKTIFENGNTVEELINLIKTYLAKEAKDKAPLMVAAGFPSVVNKERTQLYSSTNLPGLDGINIVRLLSENLNLPVIIDHDAYYLLSFDIMDYGIDVSGKTLLGLYFGTGMGNAIYINGAPYYGKNGTAAELGHLPVLDSKKPCSCGNKGCIEMYSCGKAFEELASDQFPNTHISQIFVKYWEDSSVKDFIRAMAIPVAAEINILDPHYIFIGGGLVQMEDFPKELLVDYILENTRKPYPAENLEIFFSHSSPENGVIGAAIEGFKLCK